MQIATLPAVSAIVAKLGGIAAISQDEKYGRDHLADARALGLRSPAEANLFRSPFRMRRTNSLCAKGKFLKWALAKDPSGTAPEFQYHSDVGAASDISRDNLDAAVAIPLVALGVGFATS
jgi:hypothetical protein